MAVAIERSAGSVWNGRIWMGAVWLATAAFSTTAFPPFGLPEAAYVFAVAAVLWCLRSPGWKPWLWTVGTASFVSWLVLLEWLRVLTREAGPVVLLGWIALAAVIALFPLGWFAALRWALPAAQRMDGVTRCLLHLGLAGFWVVLEWVRSWIFTGFPWLPLAASQWQRPVMLQSAAYGGAWAVSFALVLFNLGLAVYLERLHLYVRERRTRVCPEFYLGLVGLFAVSFGLYGDSVGQQREVLLRAGVLQPAIPQSVKWDPDEARAILEVLASETKLLTLLEPDAIFWPEAVTPLALRADARSRRPLAKQRARARPRCGGATVSSWSIRSRMDCRPGTMPSATLCPSANMCRCAAGCPSSRRSFRWVPTLRREAAPSP